MEQFEDEIYWVISRNTACGPKFLQLYDIVGIPQQHWGELRYANKYETLANAKRVAEDTPSAFPLKIWRVTVTATKEEEYED